MTNRHYLKYAASLFLGCFCLTSAAFGAFLEKNVSGQNYNDTKTENTYVASNDSVQQLLYVLGGEIHKPIIVSNEAAKKRVSGSFNITDAKKVLDAVAAHTGLIWYDDGSSIYVYDASEMQSRVVKLSFAPFDRLVTYLQSSGLYDARFPPRSQGNAGAFYISGPPVYVELVAAAANYIDSSYSRPGAGKSTIRVIKLKNTFVTDRLYTQRDVPVSIPGVASVLNELLNSSSSSVRQHIANGAKVTIDNDTQHALQAASATETGNFPPLPLFSSADASSRGNNNESNLGDDNTIKIVGYSDTNSLLIQGTDRQVGFVEDLVRTIDIPKKQIQLSLWIIDVAKDNIDQLGVKWQGAAKVGNSGVTFNSTSLTPEGSATFLADISALVQKGSAQVVSRPEILTQENVPALFDNNSSFYAKLIGERTSSLQKITYGTMISVLPRISEQQKEIEMILNIQDGNVPVDTNDQSVEVDDLPVVSNTQISTEARVPVGYSLLVGGYSRAQDTHHSLGVPLLKDIPILGRLFDYSYTSHKDMVRVFLIQPQLLASGATWQGYDDSDPLSESLNNNQSLMLKSTVQMLRKKIKN